MLCSRDSIKSKANASKNDWLLLLRQTLLLKLLCLFPCKCTCFEGFAVVFKVNKADAASLDAGDVYSAVKLYGLTVVAKEIYDQGRFIKQKNKLYF